MTDNVVDLGKKRADQFLKELEVGKYPALSAGYAPVEKLINWYLDGGYGEGEMLHAFAYSAAAEVFRKIESPAAEDCVKEMFESIIRDLLAHGPHYGHEAY
jgi:hypothetical protein